MTTETAAYDPARLPATVLDYLDARDEDRHADAHTLFAPDATVIDDGHTYHGTDEIDAWIERSSSEYEYTATRIGQLIDDASSTTVHIRLDGNFPGGTAALRYQFTLEGDRITRLAIEV